MNESAPPVLDDVVIHGDALRRRGLWLPVQAVDDAHPAPTVAARDLPPQTRALAERILPQVRQRAIEAGRRAAHPQKQDNDR